MAAIAETPPFRIVHTVCSHDCPDSCAVLVTVDANGRAVKVQGDPSQPVTQGFLCGKVAKYLDRVYCAGEDSLSAETEGRGRQRGRCRAGASTRHLSA